MMKRFLAIVGACVAMSGCTGATGLVPPAEALEVIAARATDARDVRLNDAEGRSYPARIYFNEAARHLAEDFSEFATVFTESRERLAHTPTENGAEADVANAEDDAESEDSPWAYVQIGRASDGTLGVGWTAPTDQLIVEENVSLPLTQSDVTDPSYTTMAPGPYTWTISSGSSTTSEWYCQYGAEAEQLTYPWSSGKGELRLMRGSTIEEDDPYQGANASAWVYSTRDATTWKVRNSHIDDGSITGAGEWWCW